MMAKNKRYIEMLKWIWLVACFSALVISVACWLPSMVDSDMASEMVEFTKNQILTQAGTAMLAQANSQSQSGTCFKSYCKTLLQFLWINFQLFIH